jgi:hypothetical protein
MTIMKTLFATALVAVGVIAATATAQVASDYDNYPAWAQHAFEEKGG